MNLICKILKFESRICVNPVRLGDHTYRVHRRDVIRTLKFIHVLFNPSYVPNAPYDIVGQWRNVDFSGNEIKKD